MTIKRTSHAVYDTSYHLVWCLKYRKKIFERQDLKERAEQLIGEICAEYGFEIVEMELVSITFTFWCRLQPNTRSARLYGS